MHGQSYLAGGIYLLCRQRSPVAWGRASDNTAQGARSDSGLLPLGKVPESGAGGGHASLEDWVRCLLTGTATTVQSEWHTQCLKEFNRHRAMPNLSKVPLDVSQLH